MIEKDIQNLVRLEAAKKDILLWRNNVGAILDVTGRPVRFGLANDSRAMNRITKSSDLIGLRKVLITPAHVGTVIGQFVAREIKPDTWVFTGTDRENAQLNYLNMVAGHGGDATFVTGVGTL
jgi:hypothetical protein